MPLKTERRVYLNNKVAICECHRPFISSINTKGKKLMPLNDTRDRYTRERSARTACSRGKASNSVKTERNFKRENFKAADAHAAQDHRAVSFITPIPLSLYPPWPPFIDPGTTLASADSPFVFRSNVLTHQQVLIKRKSKKKPSYCLFACLLCLSSNGPSGRDCASSVAAHRL